MATAVRTPKAQALPLESGDRLARAEFERRYACHPEITKAELVDGVVYVTSPVKIGQHAKPHGALVAWLVAYAAGHQGLTWADNGTVRLDGDTEVQPDVLLMREGGRASIDEDDFIVGAPELVAEVSASSAGYDLHDKMRAYRRNGVREYVVWQVLEERIDWVRLHEGEYVAVPPDESGVVESAVFPGLRLNVAAMLNGDMKTVLAGLAHGHA
jgi:Uma2 family endonuclease